MNVIIPKNTSKYQDAINAKTKVDNMMEKLLTTRERELVEDVSDKLDTNCDAVIFTILNQKFGFTAEQLRELWESVRVVFGEIKNDLETATLATYDYIPQVAALKENLGIDIVAWNKEGVE